MNTLPYGVDELSGITNPSTAQDSSRPTKMLMTLCLCAASLALMLLPQTAWAECWMVSRSRAVNDYRSGTGWCEGYWYADCTYCWNSSGSGGTCATNGYFPCEPILNKS